MELMDCPHLAVPAQVMAHVVRVESSFNPFAIGVVGGRLRRQPRNLAEAVATARMLERKGLDFSLGLAQVNRRNLGPQGLDSYARAFAACPNLQAGARILADCHARARGDWGRAFSCYYSGNFVTGFRHGYVQKVFASMRGDRGRHGEEAARSTGPAASDHAAPGTSVAAAERMARRVASTASPGLGLSNQPDARDSADGVRSTAEPPADHARVGNERAFNEHAFNEHAFNERAFDERASATGQHARRPPPAAEGPLPSRAPVTDAAFVF